MFFRRKFRFYCYSSYIVVDEKLNDILSFKYLYKNRHISLLFIICYTLTHQIKSKLNFYYYSYLKHHQNFLKIYV